MAIANDITFSSGSFGTKEDAVFRAATEYALEEKLPVIYLAANAGARVGLAQEIKQCLQVTYSCAFLYPNIQQFCRLCCGAVSWRLENLGLHLSIRLVRSNY